MSEKNSKPQLLLPPHEPQYYISCDVSNGLNRDYTVIAVWDEEHRLVDFGTLVTYRKSLAQRNQEFKELITKAMGAYKDVEVHLPTIKQQEASSKVIENLHRKGYSKL